MEHPLFFSLYLLVPQFLLWIVFNGILFGGWYALMRTRASFHGATAFVGALLFFQVQLLVAALALGVTGLLYSWSYILLNLLAAAGLLWQSGLRLRDIQEWRPDWKRLRRCMGRAVRSPMAWVLLAVGLPLLGRETVISLLNVPSVGDDLLYHVTTLFQWVTDHRITVYPTAVIYQNVYPFNSELLFLDPILFFHSDSFILFFHFLLMAAGYGGVAYALCRRFSLRREVAAAAGLLLFLTPGVVNGVFTGYTDTVINLFILFGLYFFTSLIQEWKSPWMHYGLMVAATFSLGAKYSGPLTFAFWAAAYLVLAALHRFKGLRAVFTLKACLVLSACFLSFGISWYVRNYLAYGNPLAPQAVTVAGHELFTLKTQPASFIALGWDDTFKNLATPQGNIDFLPLLVQAPNFKAKLEGTLKGYHDYPKMYLPDGPNQLGPVWGGAGWWLALLALVYAVLRKRWAVAGFFGACLAYYLIQPYHLLLYSRYSYFVVVLGVVAIAWIVNRVPFSWVRAAAMALVLWLAISSIWHTPMANASLLKKEAKQYRTGEYFQFSSPEVYLTCYDYVRLRLQDRRINYVGTVPYPYFYALYGKTLTNQVRYFYTLDPVTWDHDLQGAGVDTVAIWEQAPDKNFAPIVDYIKAHPKEFVPFVRDYAPADLYGPCREYEFYRVAS